MSYRIECKEANHSKYWECIMKGSTTFAAWGKIGADHVSQQTKTWGSPALAQKYVDKQLASKMKKGYVLAGKAKRVKATGGASVAMKTTKVMKAMKKHTKTTKAMKARKAMKTMKAMKTTVMKKAMKATAAMRKTAAAKTKGKAAAGDHKLALANFSDARTTDALADVMIDGWRGDVNEDGDGSLVVDGHKTCKASGELGAKVQELQKLIDGITLPASESDVDGFAFAVEGVGGSPAEMKAALGEALGLVPRGKKEITLKAKTFKFSFAHDDDMATLLEEGEDKENLDRLKKATDILKAYGKTYEMNFTERLITAPVLYFAQKGTNVMGVIGGRVWT